MNLPKHLKIITREIIVQSTKFEFSFLGPVGFFLNQTIFDIPDKIKARRVQILLENINEKLSSVDETYLNKDYLRSEEFYDLVSSIVKSVIHTSSNEKHKILANIFIQATIEGCNIENDVQGILIKIINELTTNHLIVMRFINQNIEGLRLIESYQSIYDLYCKITQNGVDKFIFRMYLKDLQNFSLISFSSEINDFNDSITVVISSQMAIIKDRVSITSIGHALMKHLINF